MRWLRLPRSQVQRLMIAWSRTCAQMHLTGLSFREMADTRVGCARAVPLRSLRPNTSGYAQAIPNDWGPKSAFSVVPRVLSTRRRVIPPGRYRRLVAHRPGRCPAARSNQAVAASVRPRAARGSRRSEPGSASRCEAVSTAPKQTRQPSLRPSGLSSVRRVVHHRASVAARIASGSPVPQRRSASTTSTRTAASRLPCALLQPVALLPTAGASPACADAPIHPVAVQSPSVIRIQSLEAVEKQEL